MTVIDWILKYIREEATDVEKSAIKAQLNKIQTPELNKEWVIERLVEKAGEVYRSGQKLQAVKMTKDATGWGLKDCKEWCEKMFD